MCPKTDERAFVEDAIFGSRPLWFLHGGRMLSVPLPLVELTHVFIKICLSIFLPLLVVVIPCQRESLQMRASHVEGKWAEQKQRVEGNARNINTT